MQDHFNGKYEVELKFRLADKHLFLQKLQQLSAEVHIPQNSEHDCYFDRSASELKQQKISICIRDMQPSNIKLWIVKGPQSDRCEAINITDCEKAKSMLQTMGFQQVLEIKKQRAIYFLQQFHITLDHLDGLGDFAEIAIMTDDESMLQQYQQQIWQVAGNLGLNKSMLETSSYRELVEAHKIKM